MKGASYLVSFFSPTGTGASDPSTECENHIYRHQHLLQLRLDVFVSQLSLFIIHRVFLLARGPVFLFFFKFIFIAAASE